MKKVSLFLLTGLTVLMIASCGRQQPEEAAAPADKPAAASVSEAETSEDLTAPWPDAGDKAPAAADMEAAQEPEAERMPSASDSDFSNPPPPAVLSKISSRKAEPQDLTDQSDITRISVIRELIAAAGYETVEERVAALPDRVREPISEPVTGSKPSASATVSYAPESGYEEIDYTESKREVILTSPDIISYYESSVSVSGYFTGFPDLIKAGWEISGKDLNGDLSLESDRFQFSVDTRGYVETLAVRVFAEDSYGIRAESLLVLVNNGTGPSIKISSPSNNSVFSDESLISGRIDSELKEASASLVGSNIQLPLDTDKNGFFSIPLSAFFIDDAQASAPHKNPIIKITAVDFNNNSSTEYLSLFSSSQAKTINLSSPIDGDLFTNEIILQGTTGDYSELSWDIPGTGFSGTIKPENGAFNYPLVLSGLTDRLLLRLSGKSQDKTETTTVRLSNSGKAPEIEISEPVDYGYYTDFIPLKGGISTNGEDAFETVKNLNWGIPGTENIENLIFFEQDGSFTLDLSLSGNSGLLPVEVKLEDYNNNASRRILLLQDGKLPPGIKLYSPQPWSEYGAFINIAGKISDPYSDTSYGGIENISYEIVSTDDYDLEPISGIITADEDITFGLQLPAFELEGNQQLILTAAAVNGNSSKTVIDISKSSNDITSFQLNASGNRLTADWNPVKGEASYTLLLTKDGTVPEQENSIVYADIKSPYTIPEIENGKLYSAILLADTEFGRLESGIMQAIPASPAAFGLKATGAFKQIKLDWNQLTGSDSYTVYRTDDPKGDFSLLASGISGNIYIDSAISYGRDYYYYITPDAHEYSRSSYVNATMSKAPDERLIKLNKLSSFTPVDIDVTGNYAYIAAGKDGFRIVDITFPEQMSVIGSISDLNPTSIIARGDYAYCACGPSGLNIINIMEPALPFVAGWRTTTDALDVCLKDDFAFIADGDSGIKVINISDARNPERISTIRDIVSTSLYLHEDFLFSSSMTSVQLYDVSNPSAPALFTEYPLDKVTDMQIIDTTAFFISASSGLNIVDISNVESPETLSVFTLDNPKAVTVVGNFVYIAEGSKGLKIIDITNMTNPVLFDSLDTGATVALDVSGDYVIVAEKTGLSAIQTFLQGVSFILNKLKLSIRAASLSIFNRIAFLPAKDEGLSLIDIQSPASPVELNSTTDIEFSGHTEIKGDLLYTSSTERIVSMYRISPDNENFLDGPLFSFEMPDDITNIRLNDFNGRDFLTVSTADGTVSFLEDGKFISSIRSIEAKDCIIRNNTAYLSDGRAGLMLYDISASAEPVLISSIEIEGADFITMNDNNLFVSGRKGLLIFDLSEEDNPVQIGFIKTRYAENGLIKGDYLYLAEGYKGLSIYNVNDPVNPVLASICDTVYAADIAVIDDYAFVTDGTGLNTIRIFIPDWIK